MTDIRSVLVSGSGQLRRVEAPSPRSGKETIQRHARGTYTGARTLNQKSIIDFQHHVDRICAASESSRMSSRSHLPVPGSVEALNGARISVAELRQEVLQSVQAGLRRYFELVPFGEARITIAVSLAQEPSESPFLLDVFVEPLPPLPKSPVAVDVFAAERPNPSIKHTQWAIDRKPLEQKMSHDANEVLMVDHSGHLLEGISSNFFVLDGRDGTLHTAPDSLVLPGTIRGIVRLLSFNVDAHG